MHLTLRMIVIIFTETEGMLEHGGAEYKVLSVVAFNANKVAAFQIIV